MILTENLWFFPINISFPSRAFFSLSDLKSFEDKDCLEIVKICDISFYPTTNHDERWTQYSWNLKSRTCFQTLHLTYADCQNLLIEICRRSPSQRLTAWWLYQAVNCWSHQREHSYCLIYENAANSIQSRRRNNRCASCYKNFFGNTMIAFLWKYYDSISLEILK